MSRSALLMLSNFRPLVQRLPFLVDQRTSAMALMLMGTSGTFICSHRRVPTGRGAGVAIFMPPTDRSSVTTLLKSLISGVLAWKASGRPWLALLDQGGFLAGADHPVLPMLRSRPSCAQSGAGSRASTAACCMSSISLHIVSPKTRCSQSTHKYTLALSARHQSPAPAGRRPRQKLPAGHGLRAIADPGRCGWDLTRGLSAANPSPRWRSNPSHPGALPPKAPPSAWLHRRPTGAFCW